MANKPMTFRPASEELETKIDKKVEEMGVSRNSYLNDAVEFYAEFDPDFLKALKGFSADCGMGQADMIQRVFAEWMGKLDAQFETLGHAPDLHLMTQGAGFKADYQMHKEHEVLNLERELVAQGLEDEAYGTELDENVKKLMIKYRQGRAWLESEEYKRHAEMQKYLEEKYPDAVKKNKERMANIKRGDDRR